MGKAYALWATCMPFFIIAAFAHRPNRKTTMLRYPLPHGRKGEYASLTQADGCRLFIFLKQGGAHMQMDQIFAH